MAGNIQIVVTQQSIQMYGENPVADLHREEARALAVEDGADITGDYTFSYEGIVQIGDQAVDLAERGLAAINYEMIEDPNE